MHPNTVAQRLDRIGTLLGEDWRDPSRGLDVQLALRLCRLRSRRLGVQATPDCRVYVGATHVLSDVTPVTSPA